jgi:hypothetical protein
VPWLFRQTGALVRIEGRRQKAESFYVYYWYVVARAVKESPKL